MLKLIKRLYGKVVPETVKKRIHEYRLAIKIKRVVKCQKEKLAELKNKEIIKVVFLVIHDSVWKYEEVYRLFNDDSRYDVRVAIIPYIVEDVVQVDNYTKTLEFFQTRGYNTVTTLMEDGSWIDIKNVINPDIVFFTVPYEYTYKMYTIHNFLDKLTCYVQYAFMAGKDKMFFNMGFHNLLWKFFSETELHKQISIKNSLNKGANVYVSGHPCIDKFIKSSAESKEKKRVKRIIWAPHHLMKELSRQSNFLENYHLIPKIAKKYSNEIEIIFKPHPLLKKKLYTYPEWGSEKADRFFDELSSIKNIKIEDGYYIDIFNSSDAMIHDCGSFIFEYLATKKPSLFMVRENSSQDWWNEFGEGALSVHYKSYSDQDIVDFVQNVVINENDYMKEERVDFVEKMLMPPYNNSASYNIYNKINNELS